MRANNLYTSGDSSYVKTVREDASRSQLPPHNTDYSKPEIGELSKILCAPFGGLGPEASSAATNFIATYTNILPSTPSIVGTATAPPAANASDLSVYPQCSVSRYPTIRALTVTSTLAKIPFTAILLQPNGRSRPLSRRDCRMYMWTRSSGVHSSLQCPSVQQG